MRALNGLLRRLTGHRDSWSNTSLKSQQVRKVVRPKRTSFEALEERYLLSDCVAPSADSLDQTAVDAYNACLAAETNATPTPIEDVAITAATGDTLAGNVADGEANTGVLTTETTTFAMGGSVPEAGFIVFADDTGDDLGADAQSLAVTGFSIDSAGTLRVDRPVYATATESTAGSESAGGDTSGMTSTDMSTLSTSTTTDGGSTDPAAATADGAATAPPTSTTPAPTPPTSFTIDISNCTSGSRHETTTADDGSTTVTDESWSYCYSFHATYDYASGSITVDATTNSSHDLTITYTGSSRTYTSITGSDYDFELHVSGNISGGSFAGTFSLDVSASNNSEWHETETLSGGTSGVYMLDATSNSDFTLYLARTASGRDFELTGGYDFTWNESLVLSGDVSGAYTLDVTDDASVSIDAHWGGSSGDTLDILASASFTWNESANFSDAGGVWSFSLNESASASLVVISTSGTGSDLLMVSESASYSVTLHDHATFSGDVSGNYTVDVSLSGNYSFSVIDFGVFSLSASASGSYSVFVDAHVTDATGSDNLTLNASGSASFSLTMGGTSGSGGSGSFSLSDNSSGTYALHMDGSFADGSVSGSFTADASGSSSHNYTESGSYSSAGVSATYSENTTRSSSTSFHGTVSDGTCTLTVDESSTASFTYSGSGNLDGTGVTISQTDTSTSSYSETLTCASTASANSCSGDPADSSCSTSAAAQDTIGPWKPSWWEKVKGGWYEAKAFVLGVGDRNEGYAMLKARAQARAKGYAPQLQADRTNTFILTIVTVAVPMIGIAGLAGAGASVGAAGTGAAVEAFGGTAAFGRAIGWGIGARAAAARASSITLAEIRAAGITLPIAIHWRNFYQAAVDAGRGGATAVERLRLMERVIELLGG